MSFPNLKGGDIVHIRARVAKVDGGVLVEPIHWPTAGSGLSKGKPHLVYQENILTVEHRPFAVGDRVCHVNGTNTGTIGAVHNGIAIVDWDNRPAPATSAYPVEQLTRV